MPSIRLQVDGDGLLNAIDIKWFLYDTDSVGYIEISDLSIIENSVDPNSVVIGLDDTNKNGEWFWGTTSNSITDFENEWNLDVSSDSDNFLFLVRIGYKLMGTNYTFLYYFPES